VKGEPDRVVAARCLPLLRVVVSFHAGKHAPLLFSNACTTARGHQGENELALSSVDAPAFEPRGTPSFATAPPRSPLVMPTFVPGWVSSSCRCRCRPRRARIVLCPASRFSGSPCRAPQLRSAAVAEPPACASPRACEILRAIAQSCTPARTRTYLGGQGRAFGSFFLAPSTPPTCLSCRHGLCHAGCRVHARAGEKGEVLRAFCEPSPPMRPHTFVCRHRPREPCLLSAAMSADPSTAMAEPPCATGQGVKALTFRPLWPRLFHTRTHPSSGHPMRPRPRECRRCAENLPAPRRHATSSRHRAPKPSQRPFFSLLWRALDMVRPG
jgi:hypothetical protein